MNVACSHPICRLIAGPCSLASGVGRGCRAGPRPTRAFAPEVVDEVGALLAELDPTRLDQLGARARQVEAATRLAAIVRREARDDRNLLALTRTDELEPELRTRLAALCRRAPTAG